MSKKQGTKRAPATPKLPPLLERKIYKTGQTRGADDDEIFQNRVARNSTVLIPYNYWETIPAPLKDESGFERGFIVLISPETFFLKENIQEEMISRGLELGVNALIFFEKRVDWKNYNPSDRGWQSAVRRTAPLGGQYVARISATTATGDGDKIVQGFTTTSTKGAGIRVYEYASKATIAACRLQLEALYWLCGDALEVAQAQEMSIADASTRKEYNKKACERLSLLDVERLKEQRLLSKNGKTMCPLCLEEVSANGFFSRVSQAEGRAVHDLTITQLNLFHVEELRIGRYGHRPYNLGWGHHHCNVVVRDSGIDETIIWMGQVIDKNIQEGYILPKTKED